jgi:uncharacterized membrane protein
MLFMSLYTNQKTAAAAAATTTTTTTTTSLPFASTTSGDGFSEQH